MRKICYKPENAIHDISGMPYLLTVNEVRKILRCGKSKVYDLAKEKDFPAIWLGGDIRIHRDNLKEWIIKKMREV